MKIPIFPGKYHQNGGFSMTMLVSGRVTNTVSERSDLIDTDALKSEELRLRLSRLEQAKPGCQDVHFGENLGDQLFNLSIFTRR